MLFPSRRRANIVDALSVPRALWLFLPAYVANMSPVFSARLVPGWRAPIDGGRVHRDGRRMLGDGKTWRGLAGGAVAGGVTAVAMALLSVALQPSWLDGWDFGYGGYAGGALGACAGCSSSDLWQIGLFGGLTGSLALAGDAVESYFKRRRGLERGAPWIPMDQLDFVVFGLIGMAAASPLLVDGWFRQALMGDWLVPATIVVGTIFLHLLVNRVGYWIGLKEVPW